VAYFEALFLHSAGATEEFNARISVFRPRFDPRAIRHVRSVIARVTLLGSNTLIEWLSSWA